MKIPRQLYIKGELWRVERKSRKEMLEQKEFGLTEGEILNAWCDFENRKIVVSTDIIGTELAHSWIHEIFHAVLFECHITLDRGLEEAIVDSLSAEIVKRYTLTPKG